MFLKGVDTVMHTIPKGVQLFSMWKGWVNALSHVYLRSVSVAGFYLHKNRLVCFLSKDFCFCESSSKYCKKWYSQ